MAIPVHVYEKPGHDPVIVANVEMIADLVTGIE